MTSSATVDRPVKRDGNRIGDDRRKAILAFIGEYLAAHGYAPSVREIGAAVHLVSPSSVAYQLEQLAAEGAIRVDSRIPRAIVLTPTPVLDLPVTFDGGPGTAAGCAACGCTCGRVAA